MTAACFGRISVALLGSAARAPFAGVCRLEPATWRLRHAFVTERARIMPSVVSGAWLLSLKQTGHRGACRTALVQQVKVTPLHARGAARERWIGHGRSSAGFSSLLPLGARGLCNRNADSPDTPVSADREEGAEPGQGLFKFKELYENPWTIPNLLCVCRILLAPFLGHLIVQQRFDLSLALFVLAGATDLLDGYIARRWPTQKSALGSALDPLADKILISILYVSLTYADLIPAPLTALVIFRDVGLIAAVFWVRYKTVPPPVTLSKFFNPCYTTAQLKPTFFSKVNTAIQLCLVAASLAAPVFQFTDSILLQCLWYVTAVTTAASGYSYWHYGRKTVQVLNTKSP